MFLWGLPPSLGKPGGVEFEAPGGRGGGDFQGGPEMRVCPRLFSNAFEPCDIDNYLLRLEV